MKKLWYKLKSKVLTIFGDLKIYKFPFFLIYNPKGYKVKGDDIREINNNIKPGDIIARKYDAYLDGFFIPSKYSHTGIYIGDNKIIHMIAEGCICDDIIEFCKTDYICILRPKKGVKKAIERANKIYKFQKSQYDFDFNNKNGNLKLYCHEFTRYCYKELDIKPTSGSIFGGLLKTKNKYLYDSFANSKDIRVLKQF